MDYEKAYIGKGYQVEGLQIAKVTLKLEEVQKIAYERGGVKYVTFEVAKMKQADKFGRWYTCYYSRRVQNAAAVPAPEMKKSKKKAMKNQEIPF